MKTFFLFCLGCGLALPAWSQDFREAPARTAAWGDEVLYFVVTDRFADGDPSNNRRVKPDRKGFFHGGDFVGLTNQLDYLSDLGITAIWITPVVKNIDDYVDGAGFPDWAYHGYWPDDFYSIDSRFGTEAELKKFVDEAHKRDIKVLLDVVYNHAGYGSAYTKRADKDKWVREGDTCGGGDITGCLSGLPDFKTEDPEVMDYLLNHSIELAKRIGLDGFRLDTVKHVAGPFWDEHRRRVKAELGDDFHLLAEVWGGDHRVLDFYFEPDQMDSGFDFGFKGSAQAWVQGRGRTIAFSRYLLKRHQVREGYLLSHYLSSHDVPGALWELREDKTLFKLCVALQMTSLGMPMVYYGEEVGRLGGDWPENRTHMPWGDNDIKPGAGKAQDLDMLDWYKKLIKLRRDHKALSSGGMRELHHDGDLLAFARTHEDGEVWVAVNRGKEAVDLSLKLGDAWKGKTVVEGLTGATPKVADGMLSDAVPAQSARIYTVKR